MGLGGRKKEKTTERERGAETEQVWEKTKKRGTEKCRVTEKSFKKKKQGEILIRVPGEHGKGVKQRERCTGLRNLENQIRKTSDKKKGISYVGTGGLRRGTEEKAQKRWDKVEGKTTENVRGRWDMLYAKTQKKNT